MLVFTACPQRCDMFYFTYLHLPLMQIEEKTPAPVKQAKKEASAVAEKVTDKFSKMAAPVAEAAATKRVSVTRQDAPCDLQYTQNRKYCSLCFWCQGEQQTLSRLTMTLDALVARHVFAFLVLQGEWLFCTPDDIFSLPGQLMHVLALLLYQYKACLECLFSSKQARAQGFNKVTYTSSSIDVSCVNVTQSDLGRSAVP